jgi:hypothetical protein
MKVKQLLHPLKLTVSFLSPTVHLGADTRHVASEKKNVWINVSILTNLKKKQRENFHTKVCSSQNKSGAFWEATVIIDNKITNP